MPMQEATGPLGHRRVVVEVGEHHTRSWQSAGSSVGGSRTVALIVLDSVMIWPITASASSTLA